MTISERIKKLRQVRELLRRFELVDTLSDREKNLAK
jgi:hypothetical protein